MATVLEQLKKSKVDVFRRFLIKRRLDDSSGNYETEWQDLSQYVIKWGSLTWSSDAKKFNFFTQRGITIKLDNTKGLFDHEKSPASFWHNYLTRYRTLCKIEAGFINPDNNTDIPNNSVLFYGILASENIKQSDDFVVTFNLKSLVSVLDEIPANNVIAASAGSTGQLTASDYITRIKNLTDGSSNLVVQKFIPTPLISSFTTGAYDVSSTGPAGIAVATDGTLWICDNSSDKIYNVNVTGTLLSSFTTGAYDAGSTNPQGIAVATDGTLWICDHASDKIYNVNITGTLISSFTTGAYDASSTGPAGIAVATGGTLWICDRLSDKVYNVNVTGTLISSFTTGAYDTGSINPRGITVATGGTLWLCDNSSDKIYNVDVTGTLLSSFTTGVYDTSSVSPTDIAVATDGTLWICDTWTDKIYNVDLNRGWTIDATTNILTALNTTTMLDNMSCWELAKKMAEIENKVVYIDRNRKFNFVSKNEGTNISFVFSGVPYHNETYGHTIKKIQNYMDDIDLLYNRVIVNYGNTNTSQVIKEEAWSAGDSTTSWKYGVKTLEISNDWLSAATANNIASTLFSDLNKLKLKTDIVTKFIPHLDLFDKVTIQYDPDTNATGARWDISQWDVGQWANESTPYFAFSGKDFKIIKMKHNLDKFESVFSVREI